MLPEMEFVENSGLYKVEDFRKEKNLYLQQGQDIPCCEKENR
jgi:hypothetical protein